MGMVDGRFDGGPLNGKPKDPQKRQKLTLLRSDLPLLSKN